MLNLVDANNSIEDAVEWLTKNTGEVWSWKNVIEKFIETNPETVTIVIPIGTSLIRHSPDGANEVDFRCPTQLQVCDVGGFLSQILLASRVDNAYGYPLALVGYGSRFRSKSALPASAIRFTKSEIHRLAEFTLNPFENLAHRISAGKHPDLEALVHSTEPNAIAQNYVHAKKTRSSKTEPMRKESTRYTWDKHNLERILYESKEPGMTHEKLAKKYDLSRQQITKVLKMAIDQHSRPTATPFDLLKQGNRRK